MECGGNLNFVPFNFEPMPPKRVQKSVRSAERKKTPSFLSPYLFHPRTYLKSQKPKIRGCCVPPKLACTSAIWLKKRMNLAHGSFHLFSARALSQVTTILEFFVDFEWKRCYSASVPNFELSDVQRMCLSILKGGRMISLSRHISTTQVPRYQTPWQRFNSALKYTFPAL